MAKNESKFWTAITYHEHDLNGLLQLQNNMQILSTQTSAVDECDNDERQINLLALVIR